MKSRAFIFVGLMVTLLHAESGIGLPNVLRTNGAATLDALSLLQSTTQPSVAQVIRTEGECVQLAVVVSEDGYLLTKASELPEGNEVLLGSADGTQCHARIAHVDRALDLALLKVTRADCIPVNWAAPTPLHQGEWVAAFSKPSDGPAVLRLGNISARERAIAGRGAALGIEMKDSESHDAVRIVDVGAQSPAEVAGLRPDDLIERVDDTPVTGIEMVHRYLDHRQPGDPVKLDVRRGTQQHGVTIRLASRSKIIANWTGEDYANGGVSLRTDNFADVMQFQMPLAPHDMGGPLIDLNGKVVGIAIARADRVTTYALPVKAFWNKLQEWLVADRKAQDGFEVRPPAQ